MAIRLALPAGRLPALRCPPALAWSPGDTSVRGGPGFGSRHGRELLLFNRPNRLPCPNRSVGHAREPGRSRPARMALQLPQSECRSVHAFGRLFQRV